MSDSETYKINVGCTFREWWRYNVFITAACYSQDSTISDYVNLRDVVYESGDGTGNRKKPENYDSARRIELCVRKSHRVEIYLYVIANTMPADNIVKHSPPFDLTLTVSLGSQIVLEQSVEVNQWGGAAVKFEI